MESREIYWSAPAHVWMYAVAALAMGVFAYGLYARLRLVFQGGRTSSWNWSWRRSPRLIGDLLVQRRFWSDRYAGLMHLMMLWGMLALAFGTLMVLLEADFGLPVFRGDFYLGLSLVLDILGLAATLGVLMALWRRYIRRPKRLDNRLEDALLLSGLLVVLLAGFVLEGMRVAATKDPYSMWNPVGWLFAQPFQSLEPASIEGAYGILWWAHLVTALTLVAAIPYTKLAHMITAPANQALRDPLVPKGKLPLIDFSDETVESFGLRDAAELNREERLEIEACTRCGRCQDVCPAFISGKTLTPKMAVLDLRRQLERGRLIWTHKGLPADGQSEGAQALTSLPLQQDVVWACTTCGACMQACPVHIDHPPLLVQMRRYLVMMEGAVSSEGQLALRNIETNYNPWGFGWTERAEWASVKSAVGEE